MSSYEKFVVNARVTYYWHRWFGLWRFLKKLPPIHHQDILEIGCGVGFTTELIAEKYPAAHIMATDFDEDSIATALARRPLGNVRFQQADATSLSFPNDRFDAAFAVLTLHHIEKFADAITELARVLKPDGVLYIMDIPTKSFNFFHLRKSTVPGLFSKAELIQILERNNFKVIDHGGKYRFFLEGIKQ